MKLTDAQVEKLYNTFMDAHGKRRSVEVFVSAYKAIIAASDTHRMIEAAPEVRFISEARIAQVVTGFGFHPVSTYAVQIAPREEVR